MINKLIVSCILRFPGVHASLKNIGLGCGCFRLIEIILVPKIPQIRRFSSSSCGNGLTTQHTWVPFQRNFHSRTQPSLYPCILRRVWEGRRRTFGQASLHFLLHDCPTICGSVIAEHVGNNDWIALYNHPSEHRPRQIHSYHRKPRREQRGPRVISIQGMI